jgi:hypothetical protein
MFTRPHVGRLVDSLLSVAPSADAATLAALVRMTYSHLSPARVGGTLIYQLTSGDRDGGAFSGVAIDPLGLNVNEAAHLSGILHQVEHRDGALVFGRTGLLRRAGVILLGSSSAVEAVGAVEGGTRHHSAAWHSYDRPDVLCLVVSTTGRVTVFSRGQDVSPARPTGVTAATTSPMPSCR